MMIPPPYWITERQRGKWAVVDDAEGSIILLLLYDPPPPTVERQREVVVDHDYYQ